MEPERRVRLRALLERWLPVLVVLSLVGTAGFGWLVVSTHVSPGTHAEERVTTSWDTQGDLTHRATVQQHNPVFPAGVTVENRPLYYEQVMPVANGTLAYQYRTDGSGSLTVDATVRAVIRSTGEEGSTEYWRVTRTIAERRATAVEPAEPVPLGFSVNVSRVQQRLEAIRSELGSSPGSIETALVATVDLSGRVQGERVDRQETYRIPLTIQESTYSFGSLSGGNQYSQRERVMVPNEYGPLRRYGSVAGLGLSLALLVALGYLHVEGRTTITDEERAYVEYLSARSEYDDWITDVSLPARSTPDAVAHVDTLEGLVDLAIDSDERVLADVDTDRFLVVHGGVTYVYEPPADASVSPP